ncbi:hypothetical protein ACOSQ3_023600 [Xanthoceras sorbifolium]
MDFLLEFQGTKCCLSSPGPPSNSGQSPVRCPPPVGCLKLNSNVVIQCGYGFIGVGAAIRDSTGDIVATVSKLLPSFFSAKLGEFLALREGLVLAKSLNLSMFVAEIDTSNIASAVNSSSPIYGDASFIICNIKALCVKRLRTALLFQNLVLMLISLLKLRSFSNPLRSSVGYRCWFLPYLFGL